MDNFNLKKFLVENRGTTASRLQNRTSLLQQIDEESYEDPFEASYRDSEEDLISSEDSIESVDNMIKLVQRYQDIISDIQYKIEEEGENSSEVAALWKEADKIYSEINSNRGKKQEVTPELSDDDFSEFIEDDSEEESIREDENTFSTNRDFYTAEEVYKLAEEGEEWVLDVGDELRELIEMYGEEIPARRVEGILDNYDLTDLYEDENTLDEYGASDYIDSFEEAVKYARKLSKEEGVVQHVNSLPDGTYKVSDWYDDRYTVASFEGGTTLNPYEDDMYRNTLDSDDEDYDDSTPTIRESEAEVLLPPEIMQKSRGLSIPDFSEEDLSKPFIKNFLSGGITSRQSKVGDNKVPLRAPQLAVFYLIAKGEENQISDWKEFLALPPNTIRETLRKFNKVMNGKWLDNEKVFSAPIYNFAIGVFNTLGIDRTVEIAEEEFTDENRELTMAIRDEAEVRSKTSVEKSTRLKKRTADTIVLDFQKNKEGFSSEKAVINMLAATHRVSPEFVRTVLKRADLLKRERI